MHRSRRRRIAKMEGGAGKTVVIGALERGGTVRATTALDRKRKTVQPFIKDNIESGATIHSDEHAAVWRMDDTYEHQVVNHLEAYVDGNVHTNGMENFWSLLKRSIGGTYVSVEPFHLFRYVDEQAFRYNNRKPMDDANRFTYLMRKIVGKRLTYAELTGKVDAKEAQTGEAGLS